MRIQRFHRSGIASTLARLFGPAELEADGDDANFLDNLRQVVAFAVNRWIAFDVVDLFLARRHISGIF
jgi:hypothetical protein